MHRSLQSGVLAILVACGGGGETTKPPTQPPPTDTGPKTSVLPGQTDMLDDLQAIGVDVTKDTDLSSIELPKKKKLMKLFTQALGTDCDGCHGKDFKDDTENKRIARHMWSDFVAKLRDAQGNPIFCDTCHQGQTKILARADDKVLEAFMKANYVEKMTRADGAGGNKAEHKCATCHGDPFDPDIFKNKFHAEQ